MDQNSHTNLVSYLGAKPLIASLRDDLIDQLVHNCSSDIDTVAQVLGIDPSYLSVQVRILLPYYSLENIKQASTTSEIRLIRDVLVKLRKSLESFEIKYLHHRYQNGIDTLQEKMQVIDKNGDLKISNGDKTYKIKFDLVDESIGNDIQDNLHYIHKRRNDTKFHFGLFLEDYTYPICYCAISQCDRNYQMKALSKAINDDIQAVSVYTLTRSFGFSPLPHNMMSKLFDKMAVFIKQHHNVNRMPRPRFIITALNPFLGFNGGIFLGSSFIPFATSPMEYKYNTNGLYLNRRSDTSKIIDQSFVTPPILWLTRPLTHEARLKIENSKLYYIIDEVEYKLG